MQLNQLTVIIVTFKSEEKIFSCLNTIPKDVKVIIVENSNDQKFKQYLESKYKNLKCIVDSETYDQNTPCSKWPCDKRSKLGCLLFSGKFPINIHIKSTKNIYMNKLIFTEIFGFHLRHTGNTGGNPPYIPENIAGLTAKERSVSF